MHVHVMSDIHFEHMRREFGEDWFKQLVLFQSKDMAKVLILAGDICQIGRHEVFWKAKLAQLCGAYDKVLYVPGNHEYYSSSFLEVERFLEEVDQSPNFHNFIQLAHGPYTYEKQRFVGDTMWFPDTGEDRWTKRMMSDFSVIGSGASPFEPEVYQRHEQFKLKVMANLRAGDVVVTHHSPLPASVHPQYAGSPINPFFMADMSAYLHEGTLPKLWIHGHTHNAFDYIHQVGSAKMRVYCNPHGYPHEGENPQFWNRVPLDIPDPP